MFNLDNVTENNDSKSWPYRNLIIGPSGSGKTNCLINSIQKDNNIINKIYLYAKHQLLAQSYFSVPNDVRLNCTHYIIYKLNNKIELQNIAVNHSSEIDYKDFIKIYRDCTREPFNVFDY